MSFPDADPWDAADYGKLIGRWKQMVESNPQVNCKDVVIREILTIGGIDDYETWRQNKGADDPVTYPVPAVDPIDLTRTWKAMIAGSSIEGIGEAVMARCVFLSVMLEDGHLPHWGDDREKAEMVFQHAATFPLEGPDQKTAVLFLSTLPTSKPPQTL